MKKIAWHFDFHSSPNVRIGHAPNPEEIAGTLADAEVEEVITFAKCHNGFSYYPSKVGFPHPKMKGDPFGDVLHHCRQKGINVLAYVSFGIDGEAGRHHEDWIQYEIPGEKAFFSNGFINICPFTPYLECHFLPQLKEIIDLYNPEGFFFDTMGAFRPCYCSTCKQGFKDSSGLNIPIKKNDLNWSAYGQFRHNRALALLKQVGDYINQLKPEAIVGFNQIGSPPYPEAIPDNINRLTLDISTSGPQSLQASLCANFGSIAAKPADVMPTRFNQGWGDWSESPDSALEFVSAPILAYGSRLYIGDRLHPENRLTDGSKKAIKCVANLWKQMAAEMPSNRAKRQIDTLVLHNSATMYSKNFATFAIDESLKLIPLYGAHRLMINSGHNFGIVSEPYLKKCLESKRLLIIPEVPAISEESNHLIESFLMAGGKILVVGKIPETNGKPVAWIGVQQEKKPWHNHIYLENFRKDLSPVLVRGDSFKVKLNGGKSILTALPPYDLSYGEEMGWGLNPPANISDEKTVLTCNNFGLGKVFFLSTPLFSDYAKGINFQQKIWFEDLLEFIKFKPQQQLLSPYGNVELIPYSCKHTTWSVLINHGGEELSCVPNEQNWPIKLAPSPHYPVTLILADKREPETISTKAQTCKWKKVDEKIHISLTLDSLWKIIKIKYRK